VEFVTGGDVGLRPDEQVVEGEEPLAIVEHGFGHGDVADRS
jgi:hypothetical protein